jgi:hypothetical protein
MLLTSHRDLGIYVTQPEENQLTSLAVGFRVEVTFLGTADISEYTINVRMNKQRIFEINNTDT